jgi:hypothetical protein
LQYAYYLPDSDIWVPKKLLKSEKDYLDKNENLTDKINHNLVKGFALKEDKEYFPVSNIKNCMEIFASKADENIWLPVPYFKRNSNKKSIFGPVSWARMIIKKKSSKKDKVQRFSIILAFDTKIDEKSSIRIDEKNIIHFTPQEEHTAGEDNYFALCNYEDHNLNFCDSDYHCGWVNDYLKKVYSNYLKKNKKSEPSEFPYLKYLGYYLYMLKYLEKTKQFPEVVFYSEKGKIVDVDLVIDVGNSNTCGILFESPVDNDTPFNFKAVKRLKITDLSIPEKEYDEPFSMRLAFVEAQFGEINNPEYKNFRWPSLLRLGKEAARFINQYNLDIDKGKETAAHHSSPKRYLWDSKKSKTQWEFVNYKGKDLKKAIYYEGISEQFKEDGEYAYDKDFGSLPYYSRKSLMTFTYIEIILHAISQINSHEFRMFHGFLENPRKLKRITITCPTSIIQQEQIVLRECAVEAVRALSEFYSNSFLAVIDDDDEIKNELKVIPRVRDLSRVFDELELRKDWIYDEATCGQFVFLYAEISKRYMNKADAFLNLYGKKRDDIKEGNEKVLTIGSIDIGGGTTDVMICAYECSTKSEKNDDIKKPDTVAVVKPHPLFWESFNLAGDDLLKNIVQEIVLEGKPNGMNERGCTGVIETNARDKKVPDLAVKMNDFFGADNARISYMQRIFRKNFIVQVAVPIAIRYLEHVIKNHDDLDVSFEELFPETQPNPALINEFDKFFAPVKFKEIKWKLSKDKVYKIVDGTFRKIIEPLSAILSAYGCDFVLLAGRPTTIPKIREMFVEYYPVSPERIITLNNYRVGKWYPFHNGVGYFEDPKTIVSVGALIALMGGGSSAGKLEGFTIDPNALIQNLIPTSDYFGFINKDQKIETIIIDADEESSEVEIKRNTLPLYIGYKQLPNSQYRGRPIYKLEYDDAEIRNKVKEQNSSLEDEKDIEKAIENYIDNLNNRMPFTVTLKREEKRIKDKTTQKIKEIKNLVIESALDNNDVEKKRILNLSIMTLPDEKGYWLDTGEFVLDIRNNI